MTDNLSTPGDPALAELVRAITRVAYDRSLTPADQMREIRDLINEHHGLFADPDDDES